MAAAQGDGAEPLALAALTEAMSARLTAKLYLPTALVAKQLPAGLADMSTVPRLLPPDERNDETVDPTNRPVSY